MQIPQTTGFSHWGCGWGNCWRCSKVHSSKVYNAKILRAVPCNISGVRNPWPGNVTYQDDNEDNIEDGRIYRNNGDDEERPNED
jgi:hypothetical protein